MYAKDIQITEEDKEVLRNYISLNETTKRLDKNKKQCNEKVKDIFKKYNIPHSEEFNFEGSVLTVTDSVRKTISESDKNKLIQALMNMGKSYLLMQSIEIDKDSLYTELENGNLSESEEKIVRDLMKITKVETLTIK